MSNKTAVGASDARSTCSGVHAYPSLSRFLLTVQKAPTA